MRRWKKAALAVLVLLPLAILLWQAAFPGPEFVFSADGQTLTFSSQPPGKGGELERWMSRRQPDGSWSLPVKIENSGTAANTLQGIWQRYHWVILGSLLCLAAAWWLVRRYFFQNSSLIEKCLAGSMAVHLLLVFLFSSWKLAGEAIVQEVQERIMVAVGVDNLAEERLALEIRESVASLPKVQVDQAALMQAPPPPIPLDAPRRLDLPMAARPLNEPADFAFAVPAGVPKPVAVDELPAPLLPEVNLANPLPAPLKLDLAAIHLEVNPGAPLQAAPPDPAPVRATPAPNPLPELPALESRPIGRSPSSPMTPLPGVVGSNMAPRILDFAPLAPLPDIVLREAPPMPRLALPASPPLEMAAPGHLNAAPEPKPLPAPPADDKRNEPTAVPTPSWKAASMPPTLVDPAGPPLPRPSLVAPAPPPPAVSLPELPDIDTTLSMAGPKLAETFRLESPLPVTDPFVLRNPQTRERVIQQLGGSPETESAIRAALDWFARHQESAGHWDNVRHGGRRGHNVASTSFALLSFMGWGATHQNEKSPYRNHVRKGLDWLLAQVKPDGDARGGGDMYDQGLATLTLAEAYALTRDANLKDKLAAATEFILRAQSGKSGGWRYKPGDHNADTSVVGWQVLALHSAGSILGRRPDAAFQGAAKWLDQVGGGEQRGLYGYQNRSPKPAMVAEGMFCQQLLGLDSTHARMNESALYLSKNQPSAKSVDFYYWYYGALALYQHGGPIWDDWNAAMKPVLLGSQVTNGGQAGSWNPSGPHSEAAGRVCVTGMATLTLEVYYRYLPMLGGK